MKDVLLFILCLSTVLLSSCGSDNEDVAKSTDNTGGEDNSEYVDLGLSVKWATCNLGSSKPEDAGDYYAWGEVAPKSSYYWSNYQWCKDTLTNYTKYCSNSSLGDNGFTDDKVLLDTFDDAATQKLGSPWRMPTVAECRELLKNCDWKMTDLNGVTGFLFVSKKNGSLFSFHLLERRMVLNFISVVGSVAIGPHLLTLMRQTIMVMLVITHGDYIQILKQTIMPWLSIQSAVIADLLYGPCAREISNGFSTHNHKIHSL